MALARCLCRGGVCCEDSLAIAVMSTAFAKARRTFTSSKGALALLSMTETTEPSQAMMKWWFFGSELT
ncbi:hypothetical protein SALBM311S_11970 [Streptomyces alboniger]